MTWNIFTMFKNDRGQIDLIVSNDNQLEFRVSDSMGNCATETLERWVELSHQADEK